MASFRSPKGPTTVFWKTVMEPKNQKFTYAFFHVIFVLIHAC